MCRPHPASLLEAHQQRSPGFRAQGLVFCSSTFFDQSLPQKIWALTDQYTQPWAWASKPYTVLAAWQVCTGRNLCLGLKPWALSMDLSTGILSQKPTTSNSLQLTLPAKELSTRRVWKACARIILGIPTL